MSPKLLSVQISMKKHWVIIRNRGNIVFKMTERGRVKKRSVSNCLDYIDQFIVNLTGYKISGKVYERFYRLSSVRE